jgi:radical SAM superfamily enzyme YgiQ (UPF0313 family)
MAGKGPYIRQRSISHVIKELKYAQQHFPNLKKITFWDEVFSLKQDWIAEFANRYKEEIGLPFKASLHPKFVSPEIIALLTNSGLEELVMGIQSGSERVRREVFQRPTPSLEMKCAFEIIHRAGLVPNYDLIVDNFYETKADLDESIELLLSIPRPYNLRVFSLTHLPRTSLTERFLADGVIKKNEVEGYSQKAMAQWRMTLNYKRSPENVFWNSIVVLLPKGFIPKRLIRYLYWSSLFRRHPNWLSALATLANMIKTSLYGARMIFQGRIGWSYIRTQWKSALRIAR